MIFKPQTARAVATQRITTLRIPAKPGKAGAPFAPCPFKLGREYSIPEPLTAADRAAIANGDKPTPPPLGTVRVASTGATVPRTLTIHLGERAGQTVTSTHEQPVPLHLADDNEKRAWVREHDAKWLDKHANDIRWAKAYDQWASRWARNQRYAESYILLERYRQRWEGRPVWEVRFELVTGVRFMADQRRTPDGEGQYTTTPGRALDPDAECVDRVTQEHYAKTAEGFCIGRKLARAKEAGQQRTNTKALNHPAPWWHRDAA